ncbi:MAG: hypothetical protein AAF198_02785 [Pseudomonadota bacterium]
MVNSLKPNEKIFCVEQETGREIGGFFNFSNERIETELISFSGPFNIPENKRITLLADDLQFITLLDSFFSSGSRSKHSEPARKADIQRIHSNIALVGHCPWTEEMNVKGVSFEVPGSQRILENQNFVKLLSGEDRYSDADRRIVRVALNGMELSIWYTAEYKGSTVFPTVWGPRFEINFSQPKSIDDFTDTLSFVTSFLSFNLGVCLQWRDPKLSSLSNDEIEAAVEEGAFFGTHDAIFMLSDDKPNTENSGNWGSPCLCHDKEERIIFGRCIAKWLERAPAWHAAYSLMMGFLKLNDIISAERLLAACKCLEQIPDANSVTVVAKEKIDKITQSAQEAAKELELANLTPRINSALSRIGLEDHTTRLERLFEYSLNGRPSFKPTETVIDDLRNAMYFRGHAAHRTLNENTDDEFRKLSRAISAVECLCFLLLARDLPLSSRGRDRVFQNRLVTDYANAY